MKAITARSSISLTVALASFFCVINWVFLTTHLRRDTQEDLTACSELVEEVLWKRVKPLPQKMLKLLYFHSLTLD